MRHRNSSASKGFGFVKFSSAEEAKQAIQHAHGLHIRGKVLKVNVALPRHESVHFCNIYIRGMPINYTEQHMYELFNPFGDVVDFKVLKGIVLICL